MARANQDMPVRGRARRRPGRDRLLATVDQLFYREGSIAPGIDRVIERAGVAKGTLYGNFRSKDELIDSYLERRHRDTLEVLEGIETSGGTAREQVDAVFDYLAAQSRDNAFRGCAFVIAAAEMPDPCRPGVRWARVHKLAVFECFCRMFAGHELTDSFGLACQLNILYDGALVTSALRPESGAVKQARDMAHRILDSACVRGE